MKIYKIKLTDQQKAILNDHIDYEESRRKAFSILSYLIKHINLNDGGLRKSQRKIYDMYSARNFAYHEKLSFSSFQKVIRRLISLKLIIAEKLNNKITYFLPTNLPSQNTAQSVENTGLNGVSYGDEIQNINNNINTNTNIDDILKSYEKFYKGVAGNPITSKKDLRKIAINLFNLQGIKEPYIQALVLNKINNSHVKIQLKGAVSYIKTIINEKLVETTSLFMEQQKTDNKFKSLEEKLLGWS